MSTNSSESQTTIRDRLPLITGILFFICISLLFMYLLGMRLYFPLPAAVFWVLIITAISAILFQIVRFSQPVYEPLLVIEILILGIALHMLHIIPFYGFPTTDSLRILAIVQEVVEHGIVLPTGVPAAQSLASWPLLPIWGVQLYDITGITPHNIARWFPPLVISSIFVLLLYIFIKRVFRNIQVALTAILLMVTVQYFTYEGTSFKPELLALVIMIAGLYFLTRVQGGDRVKFVALSFLCLCGVILTHHLTPFLLLLLFIVCLATNRILSSLRGKWKPSLGKLTLVISGTFTLITFIAVFSHWIYVAEGALRSLIGLGRVLLLSTPGVTLAEAAYVVSPRAILTVRGGILFWGYYIFHGLFAIILLRGLLARARERQPEFYSFTLFLFAAGVWSLVQLYALPLGTPGVMSVGRYVMLGWIWGFAPLAICILESRRRWGRQLGIVILALFMLLNIYMTPPMNRDLQTPGRAEGHIPLKEDYALAETLPFTGEVGTFKFTRNAIYDVQGYYAQDFRQVDFTQLEELDSIVIKKKELESSIAAYSRFTAVGRPFDYTMAQLNKLQELLTQSSPGGRNRIYDSNNLAVLK